MTPASAAAATLSRGTRRLEVALGRAGANLGCTIHGLADTTRDIARRVRLSDQEMQRIFEDQIVPERLGGAAGGVRRPELVVVTGQPAAGKTTVIRELVQSFREHDGAVALIADDYMQYHPLFHELRVRDDFTAGDHIYPFAERWLDMAIEYVIARRSNVILEEGVGDLARVAGIVRRFDQSDYAARLNAVAIRRERSRLFNLLRYLEERRRHGTGRYVPLEAQDVCFTGSADLLRLFESAGSPVALAGLRVQSHTEVLFENHRLPSGEWARPPQGSEYLTQERDRPLTSAEQRAYVDRIQEFRDGIAAGRRLLPDDEHVWARLSREVDELAALEVPSG